MFGQPTVGNGQQMQFNMTGQTQSQIPPGQTSMFGQPTVGTGQQMQFSMSGQGQPLAPGQPVIAMPAGSQQYMSNILASTGMTAMFNQMHQPPLPDLDLSYLIQQSEMTVGRCFPGQGLYDQRFIVSNREQQQCYVISCKQAPCSTTANIDLMNSSSHTLATGSGSCSGTSFQSEVLGELGSLSRPCCLCMSYFDVNDKDGNNVFRINAPCCLCSCSVTDVECDIMTNDGEKVGSLFHKFNSPMGRQNLMSFVVTFPQDLDVKIKVLLILAASMVDWLIAVRA